MTNSEDRDKEEDKLTDLLGSARHSINDWELNFCESVLNFMLKYPSRNISIKQAAILDKTWAKYFDKTKDLTPRDNPPAQIAPKQPNTKGFDSYEDDIPF